MNRSGRCAFLGGAFLNYRPASPTNPLFLARRDATWPAVRRTDSFRLWSLAVAKYCPI
jgi:hypothetical protein